MSGRYVQYDQTTWVITVYGIVVDRFKSITLSLWAGHDLTILSININVVCSKIEKDSCMNLFQKHDIVCLSEIKTCYPISVPSFYCVRSQFTSGEEHRGGVAVLFKNDIWPHIYDVKLEHDHVWFRVQSVPGFRFCAAYIAPVDSPYYNANDFATLHKYCASQDGFPHSDNGWHQCTDTWS